MKILGSSVPPDFEETMNSVLSQVDGVFDFLDLRRIGAVQHVKPRPAGLMAKGLVPALRAQGSIRPCPAARHR
jgi:hypothetical protein